MALLMDTAEVEPGDRAELVADTLQRMSAPAKFILVDPDCEVRGRLESWQFGSVELIRVRMSGFRYRRTPRMVRTDPAPTLMIPLTPTAWVHWSRSDDNLDVAPGRLSIADFNRPAEADWTGGELIGLQVPLDALGSAEGRIRYGNGLLHTSPLHAVVASHLTLLAARADAVSADAAVQDVGRSCVELIRALITSADSQAGDGSEIPAAVLVTQIRDYVGRHVTDSDLTPAAVARAHHISLRYLYKLCAQANFSLRQLIITERLHCARRELTNTPDGSDSIAAIAFRYGFSDPSHFTRRFREEFGATPREWRHGARAQSA